MDSAYWAGSLCHLACAQYDCLLPSLCLDRTRLVLEGLQGLDPEQVLRDVLRKGARLPECPTCSGNEQLRPWRGGVGTQQREVGYIPWLCRRKAAHLLGPVPHWSQTQEPRLSLRGHQAPLSQFAEFS